MKAHNTIADNLLRAATSLQVTSENAKRDAEILLSAVLECDRSFLYAYSERELDDTALDLFVHYVDRRLQGEPVAYIIGRREFWSLLLSVNDSTLIPRADTEVLVETALQLCERKEAAVLDLGTGSGAVALALAMENPLWHIDAVDIEDEAVELAELNARQLSITNVSIYQSDWFSRVRQETNVPQATFDLIVSNPPYVAADDPHLQVGDLRFEPRSALVAADGGYEALFTIAREAKPFLKEGGWLMLEHGYQQAKKTQDVLRELGYCEVQTFVDLGGNERVTVGKFSVSDAHE